MTAGVAHEPLQRLTSTETAQPEVVANTANDGEDEDLQQQATRPPVHARCESRDVSVCSRNTRDSLRRNVSLRSHTFTESERLFLEQLTVEGSDTDVERALRAVGDESLFFEHASPRHVQHHDDEIGLDLHPSTSSSGHDDATRDGEAASVATSERRGLDKVTSSSLTSSKTHSNSLRSSSSSNPVPATILGSQKRREVLERRRSDSSLNMATLWRAHESGLAVTSLGSQKSLLRRESSISSFGSSMSGLSVIFGNRPHPGASQEDVFRSDQKQDSEANRPTTTTTATSTPSKGGGKPPRTFSSPRILPPMPRRSPLHRRSKSATLFSPVRSNLPKIHETRKPTHARAKSFSKRRSVTFHHIDEELEFDQHLESMAITPVDAVDTIPKRSEMGKRHHSSDSQITLPPELQLQSQLQRDTSTSSIPSLHHGTPIRQDSVTSIPSLHHGNPLRDSISIVGGQSVSSIPSLHQGTPLRSDSVSVLGGGQSVSSIPSLHHANPLRSDSMSVMTNTGASVATFGSLRPANPLRQDSVASFPSLHPGNPIRQDSVATVPSLHPARSIRQDSVTGSSVLPPSSMTQGEMIQQFGVTEDVAAAWLELAESKTTMDGNDEKRSSMVSTVNLGEKRSSVISTVTLPDDVRVPDAATAPTVASTTDGGDIAVDPSTTKEDDGVSLLTPMSNREAITGLLGSRPRPPIVLRQASQNVYEGEGVEVTELDDRPLEGALSEADSYYHDYQNAPDHGDVFRTISLFAQNYGSIRTAGSFDDVSMYSTYGQPAKASEVFRDIRRSLSDDNLSIVGGKEFLLQIPNATEVTETFVDEMSDDGGSSSGWEMEYASPANSRFDAWNILQDEYANGYGGAGTLGFQIFGTSASDEASQPHVLSPPLMESLQAFLPPTKSGENFYLKYSMIRDGASLPTLLKRARGIQYTILAVETIDGEVFGSFTGQAWRKSWNYFGTGESFLWKMRHSRLDPTNGILDQAQKESEIDVYPYTGDNDFIQLCTHDRIAVGGGIPEDQADLAAEKKTQTEPSRNPLVDHEYDWGLGLALRSDLLQGSSSPCLTFGSPSLCKAQPDGERFEVMNVELWTLTPCSTEEEAEKLDLGKLFLGSAMR